MGTHVKWLSAGFDHQEGCVCVCVCVVLFVCCFLRILLRRRGGEKGKTIRATLWGANWLSAFTDILQGPRKHLVELNSKPLVKLCSRPDVSQVACRVQRYTPRIHTKLTESLDDVSIAYTYGRMHNREVESESITKFPYLLDAFASRWYFLFIYNVT